MVTPYVTPEVFRSFPTGLDLSTIPEPGSSDAEQEAALMRLCFRATSDVVRICNQELRCTVSTDREQAPGWRIGVNSAGIAEFRLDRFPVIALLGGRVSPSRQVPRSWSNIPVDALSLKYGVASELGTITADAAAVGPDTVLITPGYVNWGAGRGGLTVEVTYLNGWPHCGLTTNTIVGDSVIDVDDTTGWIGVAGTIVDGSNTESFLVTGASTAMGPGSLTLSEPLQYAHTIANGDKTMLVTSMPDDIQTATIYLMMEQILLRGTTSTTVPSLPGAEVSTGRDSGDLGKQASTMLASYARTGW